MTVTGSAGRTALVTGAAGGIGSAVARTLVDEDMRVAAVDLDADGLQRLIAAVDNPQRIRGYQVDARRTAEVDRCVARIERELGPISLLVNVAGVLRTGPVAESTDADWDAVFAVNTAGVYRFCRAVAGPMCHRRDGVIVTVGSNAGAVPRARMAAYAASKAATAQFTRCLGLELAGYGIRCNVVAPGSTDTAMQRALWTTGDGTTATVAGTPSLFRVGIPLGRMAQPQDVADAVAFLASDRARHITMQVLYVDGGASLQS